MTTWPTSKPWSPRTALANRCFESSWRPWPRECRDHHDTDSGGGRPKGRSGDRAARAGRSRLRGSARRWNAHQSLDPCSRRADADRLYRHGPRHLRKPKRASRRRAGGCSLRSSVSGRGAHPTQRRLLGAGGGGRCRRVRCSIPPPGAAVVGGNVETSQRIVDVLLGALGLVAASQGTMNNVTFGDARFGYYETIGGGAGAGPTFAGASAVHVHMTIPASPTQRCWRHAIPCACSHSECVATRVGRDATEVATDPSAATSFSPR